MRLLRRRWISVVCLFLACASSLNATVKIPISDLPERVRAAIQKQFANATPLSAERGDERNDYVYFSVVLQDGKSKRTVTFTELGEVVELPR